MPYVKLPKSNQNFELYYEVHGTGDVKIMFIMGLLTDGNAWFRQTDFFSKLSNYQCVSFDNRGIGRSSSPFTIHYSTHQMANDALALINHLNWSQCHVVGISMGGMIALELAVIAPEKLLSLTLLVTHAGGLYGRPPWVAIKHVARAIFLRDEHSITENALTMLYSSKTLTDKNKRESFYKYHLDQFRHRIQPKFISIIGQLIAIIRHYVSYVQLLKIRYSSFQCLVIVGSEDRLVRERNSYIIRRVLGCRLIKFDDAGHGLESEFANEINHELLNFYESIHENQGNKHEICKDYSIEIQAIERCCQHRTHCFIYDLFGFIQGIAFGSIVYSLFSLTQFSTIHFTCQNILLFACLNGIRRCLICIFNAFRARYFVGQHRLQLSRTSNHNAIGIHLPEEQKHGIPYDCGFEFPILSLICLAILVNLIYWIRL